MGSKDRGDAPMVRTTGGDLADAMTITETPVAVDQKRGGGSLSIGVSYLLLTAP